MAHRKLMMGELSFLDAVMKKGGSNSDFFWIGGARHDTRERLTLIFWNFNRKR